MSVYIPVKDRKPKSTANKRVIKGTKLMTHNELAKSLKSSLFADRDTIPEALDYALEVARASKNSAAVMTAVMVVVNTIAKQIEQCERETV